MGTDFLGLCSCLQQEASGESTAEDPGLIPAVLPPASQIHSPRKGRAAVSIALFLS